MTDGAQRRNPDALLRDFGISDLQRQLRDARAQSAHLAEHGRGYDRRIEELQRQLHEPRAQSAHFAEHGRGYDRRIEELEGRLQDLQQRHGQLSARNVELLARGQQLTTCLLYTSDAADE